MKKAAHGIWIAGCVLLIGVVYYKEKDMYCRLSQAENAQLRTLLGEVEK